MQGWYGAGRGRNGVCAGALAAGEAVVACCCAWELGSAGAGLLKLCRGMGCPTCMGKS